jgi:hypothetical protein
MTSGLWARGIDDGAHCVAQARRGVQVDQGGFAGQLGVDVGHPGHRALMQTEDVVEVGGEVAKNGILVDPGLPNTVRTPSARSSSQVAW